MKHKITLLALMLLITLFAFGQKPETKNNEIFWISKVERQIKGLKKNDIGHRQNHLIQNNIHYSQNSSLKSSQEIKQRLDSLVYQGFDDSTTQWINYYKYEYKYDGNGRTIQILDYEWDETTGQLVAYSKEERLYNTNGNLTQSIDYYWNKTNEQWVPSWKREPTYDANGNFNMFIVYDWDVNTSLWIAYRKYEFTYNLNGKMTVELDSNWDETNSQWVAVRKYEFTYDLNGKMTQELNYNWDETNSQWIVNRKSDHTYNADGKLTQKLDSKWDETTGQWVASWKYEYIYDSDGNMTQELNYDWNETNSQWVGEEKYEYIYDSDGNMTQNFYYYWDETNNQWVANYKNENTYDNSFSFSDLILPYYYDGEETRRYFNHMLTSLVSYDWDETSSDWVISTKGTFYYSEQNIDAVSEIKATDLKVYPNPSIDYLNIELSSNMNVSFIEIINMQGNLVKRKNISTNQNIIDIRDLSCGIYIVRIHTDKGIAMKRFIKQ